MDRIRLATPVDADSILEIYRPYVLDSPVSFETEAPSLTEMQRRISETLVLFPWIVLESENSIQGYAYAGPFKSRRAYSWSVESTVYVKQGRQGRGLGRKLYSYLIDALKNQGVVNVMGIISLPNAASVALHEKLGFKQVAQLKDIGYKLGQWWDVGYWQLRLDVPLKPDPLRKFSA